MANRITISLLRPLEPTFDNDNRLQVIEFVKDSTQGGENTSYDRSAYYGTVKQGYNGRAADESEFIFTAIDSLFSYEV